MRPDPAQDAWFLDKLHDTLTEAADYARRIPDCYEVRTKLDDLIEDVEFLQAANEAVQRQ